MGHVGRAELDQVAVEAQTDTGRDLLFRRAPDVGQEEVALARPTKGPELDPTPQCGDPVRGEAERRRLYDARTRMRVRRLNRHPVERCRDVTRAEQHGPALSDVLDAREDLGMVNVVEVVVGDTVPLHDEAGLALAEEKA